MKNRNVNIDRVKFIAIMMVLFVHASTDVFENINTLSTSKLLVLSIIHIITSVAVPLFIMASGYFLLREKKSYSEMIKDKILPLWFTFVLFLFFYHFIDFMRYGTFNLGNFLLESFFLKPQIRTYLWYIPLIIGLYLLTPFLYDLIHTVNMERHKYLISFIFVLSFQRNLNDFMNGGVSVSLKIPAEELIYIGYYLFGYFYYKRKDRINLPKYGWIMLLFIYLPLRMFLFKKGIAYDYASKPSTFLLAVLMFDYIYNLKYSSEIMHYVGINTLYLYLIHRELSTWIADAIGIRNNLFVVIVVFGSSFFVSWVLMELYLKLKSILLN